MAPEAPQDVAVAVLLRGDAVLLQRRAREPFAGQWELPGGKVLPGESPRAAAEREAQEELGVPVHALAALPLTRHAYPGGPRVRLHPFRCEAGAAIEEGEARRWVPLHELDRLPVLAGTRPVLQGLPAATP